MAKKPLSSNSDFVVGEEKILNYVMALFFTALFLYGTIDAALRHFKNIDYQSYVFALALVPAIYCFKRGNSDRVYIRVNKKGIYQSGKLVTGWSNFHDAYIAQKEVKTISIQDNFLLMIEYRNDKMKKVLRRKIPLTNTQNKSEEEVLEAVQFFWKDYRKNNNA